MPSQFIIKFQSAYVGSDSTGWLILVAKGEADIFESEDEAMNTAKNFSREPGWDIEKLC